jgi:hypothetical protein
MVYFVEVFCCSLLYVIRGASNTLDCGERNYKEGGDRRDAGLNGSTTRPIVESMPVPEDVDSAMVVNRALDVRSACMVYLALNIRHEPTPLGIVGSMNQGFDLNLVGPQLENA